MTTTDIQLKRGDLLAALDIVRATDIGALMVRKEQLKATLRDLRPQLTWHHEAPQRLTEEQRQSRIQTAQAELAEAEASLLASQTLNDKFETFQTTLNPTERKVWNRHLSGGTQYLPDHYQREIGRLQQILAHYGEPEPEWVDPRIEIANQITVLEAAISQVDDAIRKAKKELTAANS